MTRVPTQPSDTDRNTQRERERASRLRRAANLERMRATRDALQRTVLVVRTLGDPVWERFLDTDAVRMRRVLQLANEARMLAIEQAELRRLMREHELSVDVMAETLAQLTISDWDWNVARWRGLASKHFVPWNMAACEEEIERALKEVHAFQWRTDLQSTGLSFFGWQDLRRIDSERESFQFEFYKTFRGYDMMDYVNTMWDVFTNGETYEEVIIGHRVRADHDMLQQLGPNTVITRVAQRFPDMEGYIHSTFLAFRVKTETGFTQCVRSICCPELMRTLGGEHDVWPSNFIWFQWDHLENRKKGYKLRIGGCLRGHSITYANQWMMEAFGCVLRSERLATRRQMISCGHPHSVEEASE